MPGYFVGVGAGNGNTPGESRAIAEERARTALAASISTRLRSELRLRTESDSLGNEYTRYVEESVQIVAHEIRGVEVSDSFVARDGATWVRVRLSEAQWDEYKAEEQRRLRSEIDGVLATSNSDGVSVAERLSRLSSAWTILSSSPFGMTMRDLTSSIIGETTDLVNGGAIEVDHLPEEIAIDGDLTVDGRLTFSSAQATTVGRIPVEVTLSGNPGSRTVGTSTDDGRFSIPLPLDRRRTGDVSVSVSMAIGRIGLANMPGMREPRWSSALRVTAAHASVLIHVPNAALNEQILAATRSVLADAGVPLRLDPATQSNRFHIEVSLQIRDLPPAMDGAPLISEGEMTFSLSNSQRTLVSLRTRTIRAGGIDRAQARESVAIGIVQEFVESGRYSAEIRDSFSL